MFIGLMKRTIYVQVAAILIVALVAVLGKPVLAKKNAKRTYKNFQPGTYYISTKRHSKISRADLKKISRYKFVLDFRTFFTKSQIRTLHKMNGKIKIIRQFNGGHIFRDWSDYHYIDKNHPDWFAKTNTGKRVMTSKTKAFVLEPSSSGYQRWIAAKARNHVKYGYDGVLADFFYYPHFPPYSKFYSSTPVNPANGKKYSARTWIRTKNRVLKAMKKQIGRKILIVNGYKTGRAYNRFGSGHLLKYVDGVFVEGFTRWPEESLRYSRSERDWKKDIKMVNKISSKRKIILLQTNFKQKQKRSRLTKRAKYFAFGTYLLSAQNKTYFEFNSLNMKTYWGNESHSFKYYRIKLGRPVNNYYKKNKVYQRDFSKGKVLVNPSGKSYKIRFKRKYRKIGSKIRFRVFTLKRKSSAILVKTK